jgi:hypothetical protein
MKWAHLDSVRVEPKPKLRATCPVCLTEVRAKCGAVNIWHWAHKVCDCDPWHESETLWHKNWKDLFPEEWQEVVIGKHRADIQTPNLVIELQHSSISVDDIKAREAFYKRMIWIFDVRRSEHNISIRDSSYGWMWPKRTIFHCEAPVFIHLGKNRLFNIASRFSYDGYCRKIEKDEFLALVQHPDYFNMKAPIIYNMNMQAFQNEVPVDLSIDLDESGCPF